MGCRLGCDKLLRVMMLHNIYMMLSESVLVTNISKVKLALLRARGLLASSYSKPRG